VITKKELRERAIARANETKDPVQRYIDMCYTAMEAAADNGKFFVDVEIPGCYYDREIALRVILRMTDFNPNWLGDGILRLSW
jgi:hypothetical protein